LYLCMTGIGGCSSDDYS